MVMRDPFKHLSVLCLIRKEKFKQPVKLYGSLKSETERSVCEWLCVEEGPGLKLTGLKKQQTNTRTWSRIIMMFLKENSSTVS